MPAILEALRADILAGRARGYYVSRNEAVIDVMGISIARRIGEEPYGIGVAGPTSRLEQREENYVRALHEADRAIERIDIELRGAC